MQFSETKGIIRINYKAHKAAAAIHKKIHKFVSI